MKLGGATLRTKEGERKTQKEYRREEAFDSSFFLATEEKTVEFRLFSSNVFTAFFCAV